MPNELMPGKRFFDYVRFDDGCCEWTGGKSKGYGRFRVYGKTILAHRFSWELFNGPIPE